MLCSNYSYSEGVSDDRYPEDPTCDETRRYWGNIQYEWIIQTLQEWKNDDSIVWTATVQHHPLWGKHYHDYDHIVNNYMPLLMEYEVDFYWNGHEHTMVYANYPYS